MYIHIIYTIYIYIHVYYTYIYIYTIYVLIHSIGVLWAGYAYWFSKDRTLILTIVITYP